MKRESTAVYILHVYKLSGNLFQSLPDRVPERHRPAVDIHFVWVDVQHLNVGQNDHTEGLVYFPHRHVFLLHASRAEHLHQNTAQYRAQKRVISTL